MPFFLKKVTTTFHIYLGNRIQYKTLINQHGLEVGLVCELKVWLKLKIIRLKSLLSCSLFLWPHYQATAVIIWKSFSYSKLWIHFRVFNRLTIVPWSENRSVIALCLLGASVVGPTPERSIAWICYLFILEKEGLPVIWPTVIIIL